MKTDEPSGHGMGHGAEGLSGQIESWDKQLEHHIKQQAQQVANQECDVDASPISCKIKVGEWVVELMLLGDDWDCGDLFAADKWTYRSDQTTVTYSVDETDPMEEIRERLTDSLRPLVADKTPFSEDMLSFSKTTWNDDTYDHYRFDI